MKILNDDLVTLALAKKHEKAKNHEVWHRRLTKLGIRRLLGRRICRMTVEKADGVYVGSYRFEALDRPAGSGVAKNTFAGFWHTAYYNLFMYDETGQRVAVESLSQLGDYFTEKHGELK
jgi:hypothetical protein